MIDDLTRRSKQLGLVLPPGLTPEAAERLLDLFEADEQARPKPTVAELVAARRERLARDEETRRLARRIFEENRELFAQLGDR